MDINIILGVLLILIMIYFLALVISLRIRNRQAEQASQWNRYRDRIVTQAREDQVEAHRISLRLQKQYNGLDAPYEEERDRAFAILQAISKNAQTVLNDQNNRLPIDPAPEPYSWKTFLISPLLAEFRARQDWWQTTQQYGAKLSKNPHGFASVEKLEKRLAGKGEITRNEYESLKIKTDKLIRAFEAEARTATQFQGQIQQLEQLGMKINQSINNYLSGDELSPKQVATAVSNLRLYQAEWDQLNLTLKKSKQFRWDTRSQLEKNQVVIDTIEKLLRTEQDANRPTQNYRQALDAEIKHKGEQEQKRKAGTYLILPAQEQHTRLKELEKNLRVLIQERLMLEERISRGEREITLTEAWINTIEAPYVIDQTDVILEEVQKQQSALDQMIRSSEDLDLLSSQIFIDPKKLTSNRIKFDQQQTTYQSVHQELQKLIPPAIEQVRLTIQNLVPLNTRYHQGLNLNTLAAETQSLVDTWNASKEPSQIRESQIDQLIADLRQLEKSLHEIKATCQKGETGYQASSADLRDAQRIIEDQAFTEYHQVMQVISRENQDLFSDQAGDYARQAEGLNAALEQINSDFGETAGQAAALLANMKTLWEGYQKKYAAEKKEYQSIVGKLIKLQSDLEKYKVHELSTFQTRVSSPLTVIADWLQIPAPQSIQALETHNDEGYVIQVEIGKTAKELLKENQNYSWAKEEALSAMADAKTAIKQAEKEFAQIPWGQNIPEKEGQTSQQRKPELEHSYRYLDTAEIAFQEITEPEIEYHNSVEKAVSDLSQRVRKNANNAREEAKSIYRETRQQINDIEQKREDLEKTLAQGQGYSTRLDDTGFRSQWGQIYRKYSQFDSELENQASYREAFSYLEQALIESRYQIERMREFENSR